MPRIEQFGKRRQREDSAWNWALNYVFDLGYGPEGIIGESIINSWGRANDLLDGYAETDRFYRTLRASKMSEEKLREWYNKLAERWGWPKEYPY